MFSKSSKNYRSLSQSLMNESEQELIKHRGDLEFEKFNLLENYRWKIQKFFLSSLNREDKSKKYICVHVDTMAKRIKYNSFAKKDSGEYALLQKYISLVSIQFVYSLKISKKNFVVNGKKERKDG